MRTTGQLRRDNNKLLTTPVDSHYKPIERAPKVFAPLAIPRTLKASLPFASKPKDARKRSHSTLATKRAVVMEKGEKRSHALLQQLSTLRHEKQEKRKLQQSEAFKERSKKYARVEEKKQFKHKEQMKDLHRKMGKEASQRERSSMMRFIFVLNSYILQIAFFILY